MSTDWHSLPPDAPPETHIALLDARQRSLFDMLKSHKTDPELHIKITGDQRDLLLKAIERERMIKLVSQIVGWSIAALAGVAGLITAFEKLSKVWPW